MPIHTLEYVGIYLLADGHEYFFDYNTIQPPPQVLLFYCVFAAYVQELLRMNLKAMTDPSFKDALPTLPKDPGTMTAAMQGWPV